VRGQFRHVLRFGKLDPGFSSNAERVPPIKADAGVSRPANPGNSKTAALTTKIVCPRVAVSRVAVPDRWAIEEHFHDVKKIWGAGEQHVRNVWASIGCWNLCGWLYSLTELERWDQASEQLVDRSDRPWDNPGRRPSHNDRRRLIARKMLRETFFHDLHSTADPSIFRDRIERLLALATRPPPNQYPIP
jgi:hypothetical protein